MAYKEFFSKAIELVSASHSLNERLASQLASIKSASSSSGESVVVDVPKSALSCSVAGVDSGFVSKKLSFIDLVLIKTAGVVFDLKDGRVTKTNYYPAPFSFPEPILLKAGLEKDEEMQSVSLIRLEQEVSCAIEVIKKHKPNYLFIDGSIVPQYQDKPRKESGINEEYHSIVSLFQILYKVAEENSCTLIACVEDSRGTRFRQILQEEILSQTRAKVDPLLLNSVFDASLLDYYLRAGERTFAFPYTDKVENHAILKDYSLEWAKNIFVFYLKASDYDKPIRVEFVCKHSGNKAADAEKLKKCAQEISSVVFSLSSLHKEYSFPSVLIEADLRAGLSEQEINVVYQRLIDQLGTKIRMRRGNRPFG